MATRRRYVAQLPPASRSKVSNGSRLLANTDARSSGARRFRDLVKSLSADLGDDLSESDLALVRQAAALIQRGEQLQADIAAGRDVDPDVLTKLSGASRRTLAAISVKAAERKPAGGNALQAYLAAKAAAAESDEDGDDGEG
jgi:hypothetical protein